MNIIVLVVALLTILGLAVGAIVVFAIGGALTTNNLPLPWFSQVKIPPMPERTPTIGMPAPERA